MRGWTEIENSTLRDARLSYRARGVLARLLSNADGFRMSAADLAREGKEGRDAILAALRELRETGYLVTTKYQDSQGRWATQNVIFDTPQAGVRKTEVGKPDSGFPDAGGPDSGSSDLNRSNKKKDQKKDQQKQHVGVQPPAVLPADKKRRVTNGIVCWDAEDQRLASRLTDEVDRKLLAAAISAITASGKTPVPGVVEAEVERLARAAQVEQQHLDRLAAIAQPPQEPEFEKKGREIWQAIARRRMGGEGRPT